MGRQQVGEWRNMKTGRRNGMYGEECRIHVGKNYAYISLSFFVVPTNGLVIYCGTIVTEEGKEKKVNIDFEPFRPINTSLYLCDNKFHTEVGTFKATTPVNQSAMTHC